MNIGLMFSFRNPPKWKKPWADVYEAQLEQARLAEELGYDTVWLTEHHFAEDGYSPSLMTIAGALAAATRRVRIGTFLLLLPLHNAVRVAEDAATVDVISRGRLDLGIGKGYAVHEFLGYGIPRKERPSRFEEGIDVLRGMWTKEPFSFAGKHYNLQDIRLTPKPVQHPHPPLWIGALGRKAVDRAARLGCNFLGASSIGDTAAYDEALRRHGRNPADYSVAQLVWVHLAPSREQAWDEVQDNVHWMLSVYGKWLADAGETKGPPSIFSPPPSAELRRTTEPLLFNPLVGTPEEVGSGLEEFCRKARTTHLVLGMHFPGLDPKLSRRSMETFAKELMPRFRASR
jgi:alkanesulfonate monooxygenase SsuD/methylene tetrahydromethanopterin reductase-like flavin-dependent oxidoreductase (luciferase family)